jgi:hypothetical protein
MRRPHLSARGGPGSVVFVVAVGLTVLGPTPAVAGGPITVDAPGSESTVGCLTGRLCELGGTSSGTGRIVSFQVGGGNRSFAVRGSRNVLEVSCPSVAGCVALDFPNGVNTFGGQTTGVAAEITVIGRTGVPRRTVPLQLPAGATLGRIDCTSLNSCELAGENDFTRPVKIVLAHWNGPHLALHEINAPSGGTNPAFGGLSCSGSSCELVATTQQGTRTVGIIVTIRAGQPTGMHFAPGAELNDVSCTRPSLCYATGAEGTGGVVMAINRGIPGSRTTVPGTMYGIACRSNRCTAVGALDAGVGTPFGEIVELTSGKLTGTRTVAAAAGLADVAVAGRATVAVGPGDTGTAVTTG